MKKKPCHTVLPGDVSPTRLVPPHIRRPDYAATGHPVRSAASPVATPDVIRRMRGTCRLAAQILDQVCALVRPGITTDSLDQAAHEMIIAANAYPSPLNYHGFPKSICTSVNEVICHGIPDSRILEEGDIVNIDVTVFKDGVHGDCSKTVPVGKIDIASQKLVKTAEECLAAGIAVAKAGNRIFDIGKAITRLAETQSFSVVRAYCGHGLGETFHNSLMVPHNIDPSAKTLIVPGMIFTIEPMINAGSWKHAVWDDNWTAVTLDGKRSAQFEHTILVREDGVEILTLADPAAPQPFLATPKPV